MATPTRVPLEVYLRCLDEYEPDAEYVDGEIEERPVGEHDHAAWQRAIIKWFLFHEDEWRVEVLPELRVQTSPTRFRVPDVALLDLDVPAQPVTTYPPVAVFEVLSPKDQPGRMTRKLGDYAAMGIQEVWVINPETGIFTRLEDGQLVPQSRFIVAERGINFEMTQISELVRKPRLSETPSASL